MIIGHGPAGYIVSHLLFPRFARVSGVGRIALLSAGITGAVAPDLDMLYFYLVDHRQHHHHSYFTHFPSLWIGLLLISALWLTISKDKSKPVLTFTFSINGLIHMMLDSVAGGVWWMAPLDGKPFSFAIVPALYKPWWVSFLLHWSFLLELFLVALAVAVWYRSHNPTY